MHINWNEEWVIKACIIYSFLGKASKYAGKILNIPSSNCFSLIQNKSVQNSSKVQLVIAFISSWNHNSVWFIQRPGSIHIYMKLVHWKIQFKCPDAWNSENCFWTWWQICLNFFIKKTKIIYTPILRSADRVHLGVRLRTIENDVKYIVE